MLETTKLKLLRQYIKMKLLCDNVTWRGAPGVRSRAAELVRRTVQAGEAHSALLIGPRGVGKTTVRVIDNDGFYKRADASEQATSNAKSFSIFNRRKQKEELVSSVLAELEQEMALSDDAVVVRLNGLLHQDEKLALQAITSQMSLENAVGDRVFGTVAENLNFLLSCLRSGEERRCKSMVFILEEFHLFCRGGTSQTLLYNLFDITHSRQAPLCVIGITSRLDVMELLEKRVKSRFSHRHIFIFPNEADDSAPTRTPCERFLELFVDLLSLPRFTAGVTRERETGSKAAKRREAAAPSTPKSAKKLAKGKRSKSRQSVLLKGEDAEMCDPSNAVNEMNDRFALPLRVLERCKVDAKQLEQLDEEYISEWNAHVRTLSEDTEVVDAVEKFCYYTVDEQIFRDVLFRLACRMSAARLTGGEVAAAVDAAVAPERRRRHLQSLSVLEFSLLIAMKHGAEIFDGQPVNFEMVLHRYTKFANANSSAQSVPRPVVLKAFEHLRALELVAPVRGEGGGGAGASRVQKEYQLYALAVAPEDIRDAAAGFRALPTEIMHWLSNSVV